MNQKCCTTCQYVDVNVMSDERYCSLKDYEPIKLRWHKQRPDWCPLVIGAQKGGKNEYHNSNCSSGGNNCHCNRLE